MKLLSNRSRLRWLGHVYRMDDEAKLPKNMSEGIRTRGKPRPRWIQAVAGKIDVKKESK